MWPDGARSATRKEQEGATCATRVTRATFDFQEGDGFELRSGNLQGIFQVLFKSRSSINLLSKHLSGAERSK